MTVQFCSMPCPLCDDTGWKPVEDADGESAASCAATAGASRSDSSVSPTRTFRSAISTARSRTSPPTTSRSSARSRRRDASPRRFRSVGKGLFLEGQPGVGKTHLAVAVLKQVIQTTGARGLFYDTRDLLRVIRSTYDPSIRTTELEVLRPVMTADLLVLDDLGAEKTSEWVEETMNLIVNTRYNERRADDLHVELPGHPGRHRPELAAVPHRPPDAVAAARDVRVRRAWTAPTIASCRPTAASTISIDAVEDAQEDAASAAPGRQARAPAARARLRDGTRRPQVAGRTGGI